jgi:putative chitinase
LARLWPHGDGKISGLRAGIIAAAPAVFAKYGIATPLLVARHGADLHECGAGRDAAGFLQRRTARLTHPSSLHLNRYIAP